ncbi:MAG: hypothetical protein V7K26_00165 [Nostoc sp.]|uniref:hypothetical protein n=1 Tax=Nostoc sp. TaxID=1180 RepID=UPI002FF0827B
MPITDDRRNYDREKDSQRNPKNVVPRLEITEREGSPIRNDSNTIFYPDSEGGNQTRSRVAFGGQATIGGIHRRLKELHETCLTLIESQQRQLESSLQNSKQLTVEIHELETLLAETLEDIPEE